MTRVPWGRSSLTFFLVGSRDLRARQIGLPEEDLADDDHPEDGEQAPDGELEDQRHSLEVRVGPVPEEDAPEDDYQNHERAAMVLTVTHPFQPAARPIGRVGGQG